MSYGFSGHSGVFATTFALPFGPQTLQHPRFCVQYNSILVKALTVILMVIAPYP